MVLSQREKALVAVPLLLACLFGFYKWVHEPLLSRRAQAQALSDKNRLELKSQQAKLTKEGDLKSRLAAVASREETLDAWVPGKNSAALFIWYLSQAEARSGVKIRGLTVGERKEVQAVKPQEQPKAAPGTLPPDSPTSTPSNPASSAPASPGAAGAAPAAPGPTGPGATQPLPTQPVPAQPVPMLTMVQLDLKVDGRFAEHLLFNQELDAAPLVFNTTALELAGSDQLPLDQVAQFLSEGNAWAAEQALQVSPTLGGSYQIKLYFKSGKVGPSTDAMQFAEPTGRPDPFVMDGVDEFLQALIDHFSSPPLDGTTGPATNYTPKQGPRITRSQMG